MRRVVIIDDDDSQRNNATYALNDFYHISSYSGSGEILSSILSDAPDLFIVDEICMPSGGFEMARSLRMIPELSNIPILISSQQDNIDVINACRRSGVNGIVKKPYRKALLLKSVISIINSNTERQWEYFPDIQRNALTVTSDLFKKVSTIIDNNTPLEYGIVKKACIPIMAAVSKKDYSSVLDGVKSHDNYTFAHSIRVAVFLSLCGQAMGLNEQDLLVLTAGGLLHDVGKLAIPLHVLNKPGRLDIEEFSLIKSHVSLAEELLTSGEAVPRGVIVIVQQHHEKLDGTGYPHGLKGGAINELGRIAAIADVFSALTDRRTYKPALTPELALETMADQMAGHLDTRVQTQSGPMSDDGGDADG